MDQQEFLAQVLGDAPGLLCLGRLNKSERVSRQYVRYPLRTPVEGREWTYFIPALFDAEDGDGHTRAIAIDLDETESTSVFVPGLAVASSEHRTQGYFLLNEDVLWEEAQSLARRVAPSSDPTQFMRLPDTLNTKYSDSEPFLTVVSRAPLVRYPVSAFRKLPDPNGTAIRDLPSWAWAPEAMGPKEFARSLEHKYPKLGTLLGNSSASFDDVLDALSKIDIPDEQRVYLARKAMSNPHRGSGGEGRETAKALVRRRSARLLMDPVVQQIVNMRRNRQGNAFERTAALSSYVVNNLKARGVFIHSATEEPWYVDRESGQVVALTPGSERLKVLITGRLGINPVDVEHRHVREELIAHTKMLPPTGRVGDIAFYDREANNLSIYLGGRDVLRLTTTQVSYGRNGDNKTIFKLPPKFEPLPLEMIDLDGDYSGWWEDFYPGMPNVVGMTQAQASALLRVWLTFLLFQSNSAVRPLLVFDGVFGSGKSTMLTAIYRLVYGVQMGLIKMGTSQAFDTALSNHLLAFFDNVDRGASWLNEKLATAISRASDDRRKLYTDNDLYSVVNRALVGFTSRNLPNLEEDAIDRMLHFSLLRYEDLGIELIPEEEIYTKITANRHRYMSGLIQDARRVLGHPRPQVAGITWRIADFVSTGVWIAETLGILQDFQDGLASLKVAQRGLTLEADQPLVYALESYAARCKSAGNWKSATDFWEEIMLYTSDDNAATLRTKYKNSQTFVRKLYSIIGFVNKVIPVEYQTNEETSFRQWRIKKEES